MLLGGNQDAYATAASLSFPRAATSNFKLDGRGVRAALTDLGGATSRIRRAARTAKHSPAVAAQMPELRGNFLRGFRSAERDLRQRG